MKTLSALLVFLILASVCSSGFGQNLTLQQECQIADSYTEDLEFIVNGLESKLQNSSLSEERKLSLETRLTIFRNKIATQQVVKEKCAAGKSCERDITRRTKVNPRVFHNVDGIECS
ncbi:hypothetical protein SK128_006014 [Halocaridina rubra]|uniref:Uncharacterized protein n=1 Tax=Halocaridina rubra TaxID=373956 RepID=A0AAN8WPY3_HALRR